MKTFGIRISVALLIVISVFRHAQSQIVNCPCNKKCDGIEIIASFSLNNDKTFICDGEEFTVKNNSNIPGISYYIWDWGDGKRDSVTDNSNQKHTYRLSKLPNCIGEDKEKSLEICLLAIKKCQGNKFACHNNTSPVTVIRQPIPNFIFTQEICKGSSVAFINASCYVDDNLPDPYLWKFHDGSMDNQVDSKFTYNTTGNFPVNLKVRNECGYKDTTLYVKVVDYPISKIALSDNAKDGVVCLKDQVSIIDSSNFWAMESCNKWTYPSNKNPHIEKTEWKVLTSILKKDSLTIGKVDSVHYIDKIDLNFLKVGNYTFTITSVNACTNSTAKVDIKVVDAPTVNLFQPVPLCETDLYKPNFTIDGTYKNVKWTFEGGTPPMYSNTFPNADPGTVEYPALDKTYKVILEVTAECGTITKETSITVVTKKPVQIIDTMKVFCRGSGPDTLYADKSGGIWSGPGLIDKDKGIFNFGSLNVGKHIIKYTFTAAKNCESEDEIEIEVKDADPVMVADLTLCEDSPPTLLIAKPNDGTWSGDFIDPSNLFNPTKSGVGTFKVSYTRRDSSECIVSKEIMVVVQKLPTIVMPDTSLLCIEGGVVDLKKELALIYDPITGSDTFYVNGMKVNNPLDLSAYSIGLLSIKVVHKDGACTVSDTGFIKFITKPILSISPIDTVCINDLFYPLMADPLDGEWSGLGVDQNTGIINLKTAQKDTHSYTYIFKKGTTCEVSKNTMIKINDPGQNLSAGPNETLCYGPITKQLTGSPSGGTWSGTAIDKDNGIIDLTQLKSDTVYTYQYCLKDNTFADCSACADKTLIIYSLPSPSFTIEGLTCIGDAIAFTNTTLAGSYLLSTVKWNFGDGATSMSNPVASHAYTTKDTYTVTLSVSNNNGCSNSTSQDVYVTTKPEPDFELIRPANNCAPYTFSAINKSRGDSITYKWTVNGKSYTTIDLNQIVIDSIIEVTLFTVLLTATNKCGPVTKSDTFTVRPYPRADIGISNEDGCSPLTIDFTNKTLGQAEMYMWDMGNGNMYNDSLPPDQIYTTNDTDSITYKVRLIAKNDCGTDTKTKNITVYPPNVKAFIQSPPITDVCQYDSHTYIAYSTGGAINTWQLISPYGRESGASGDTAKFVFDTFGRYTIVLNAARCGSDTDTAYVTVKPAPKVNFEVPDFVCLNNAAIFKNTSMDIGSSFWEFGDGSTSIETNASHFYASADTFKVKLTVQSSVNGCPNSIVKNVLIVGIPTAAFTIDTMRGCMPLRINFTNKSIGGINYDWDFGDTTSHVFTKDASHLYLKSGVFKASLKVYDDYNCFTDTSIINIVVHPKPIAGFSYENKRYCHRYDTIHLVNSSKGAVGYIWQYEKTDSSSIDLNVLPDSIGQNTINLIAISDQSCLDTATTNILVLPSPTSKFEVDQDSGCMELLVTFQNKSTYGDRYIWYFGNGNTAVNKDTAYLYQVAGRYEAKLIAINDNGCPNDTDSMFITVHQKPEALFTATKDSICGTPMKVTLTNQSKFFKDSEWFVDGKPFSQDISTSFICTDDKIYTFTLYLQNEFKCKDTIEEKVPIYLQPKADFTFNDKACEGDNIVFENLSTNANYYEWEIEGKGMTTKADPIVAFENAGLYKVRLIAAYNESCKDTFNSLLPITIFTKPTADFTYNTGYNDDIKGEVLFTNASIDFDSLHWNFGDGYTSSEINPMHEYDMNRPITVVLTAFNYNSGLYTCADSISKDIAPEWIKTFYAPNAMSPDYGTGLINVFKPVGRGIKSYVISIFSPWGEKVWTNSAVDTSNGAPTGSWDGQYKDEDVPQGTYTWWAAINWEDNTKTNIVGSVTVLR